MRLPPQSASQNRNSVLVVCGANAGGLSQFVALDDGKVSARALLVGVGLKLRGRDATVTSS
jgi:hypothetical protein